MSLFSNFNIENTPYDSTSRDELNRLKLEKLNLKLEKSIQSKPIEFTVPSLNLSEEEKQQEDEMFMRFMQDTEEGQKYVKASNFNDIERQNISGYFQDKEEFFKRMMHVSPSSTSKVLDAWRYDREDTPMLSVAIASDTPSIFRPREVATSKWNNVNDFTYRGSSLWGALLDKEASSPQFTELLGRNAQANVYAAIRARGGQKGELWETAKAKSSYLNQMLTDSTKTNAELEDWITSMPNLLSLKGSIPFSAYAGNTVLDILKKSEVPEGWDPLKAIEELKVADPGLSKILFEDMDVTPERLKELARSPLEFKYFIADAIDQFSYQKFLYEYQQSAGGVEHFIGTMAWPLVRDSFNSNDQLAETAATIALLAASSTGVGAVVGGVLAADKIAKVAKYTRLTAKTFDRMEALSKWGGRVAKMNSYLWKAKKFLPSSITETALEHWSVTKKLFEKVPEGTSFGKRFALRAGAMFVGEAAQGMTESVVQQYEAMSNGYQDYFSPSDVVSNALQEGIGGLVLGGPIRGLGNISEKISTTSFMKRVSQSIEASKAEVVGILPTLSPKNQRNLDLATRMIMGIPEDVALIDFTDALASRIKLNSVITRLEESMSIPNLLEESDKESPLMKSVVDVLSGGDSRRNFASRVELLRRAQVVLDRTTDETTGKSSLTREEFETMIFLTAYNQTTDTGAKNKLLEALWLTSKHKEGITKNKDGTDLVGKNATEAEIADVANKISNSSTALAQKLGAESAEEIDIIFGKTIGEEQTKLTEEVLKEKEKQLSSEGKTEEVKVSFLGLPLLGIFRDRLKPSTETTTKTTPTVTTTTEAKPEVVKSETNNIADKVVDDLGNDLDNIQDEELTEDEISALQNRSCYIKGN